MFETYMVMLQDTHASNYTNHNATNTLYEAQARRLLNNTIHHGKPKTLKDKIDMIFEDDLSKFKFKKKYFFLSERFSTAYHSLVGKSKKLRDSMFFTTLVTITILVIGCVTGYETNIALKCQRYEDRLDANKHQDDNEIGGGGDSISELVRECETLPLIISLIGEISQGIFASEACIKIIAKGTHPSHYFTDEEDGVWNCIDFFIVIVGFMELTPAGFVFKHFPIVLLRLLRLLRVFRVAKAFPRLRSIVEALVSAFSTVKWICVLFTVFNYIVACLCMIVFRSNVSTWVSSSLSL